MIGTIRSDLPSFKQLEFKPGLNILLADKSEGASDRQSRNGAGKTSLVELVHFLCGSRVPKSSIFRADALARFTFEAEMDVGGERLLVSRSGRSSGKVGIEGLGQELLIEAGGVEKAGRFEVSNENWKTLLGKSWFGLDAPHPDERNRPSFRSLFSYFARRQDSGAFQDPVRQSGKQQLWDQQVAISYLLDLNWRVPSDLEGLRGKERTVRALGRAARSGELGEFIGRAADLRTRLAVVEGRVDDLSSQLKEFRIIPGYQELLVEANEATVAIKRLGEENLVDRELVRDLEDSLADEAPPDTADLERLYAKAGIALPDVALRRIGEAEEFHRAVIENRRSHLASEIESASSRIARRENDQSTRDGRRQQIMEVLESGGALEQYTAMREELGRAEAEAEALRRRLAAIADLERSKADLKVEKARIAQDLRDDIHERESVVKSAIVAFEALSRDLYETAGSLTIDATENGPVFDVRIEGERSKGITNMQIFCFDLMLMARGVGRGRSPGFLVHDSHLFDGVDERQIAKAIRLGADHARTLGYQYVVTLNSDILPESGYGDGFDVSAHVVDARLTDATEDGGLFGLRF